MINRGGGLGGMPDVVKNLLIINVILFVATWILSSTVDLQEILSLYFPASPYFKPYQLVSHMFMHAGLFHIFFNMFALWMFGSSLERVWGPKRFLIYYFITGFGAAALHMGIIAFEYYGAVQEFMAAGLNPDEVKRLLELNHNPNAIAAAIIRDYDISAGAVYDVIGGLYSRVLGASGAVYGLLLGFGMLFPNMPLYLIFFPVPIKAKYFVLIFGAIELISGLSRAQGDNVAHFAHLGGMLFGFILIKIWQKDRSNFY